MSTSFKSVVEQIACINLDILYRDFEEELVRVIVLEDLGPIYVSEGVVELSKGSEYNLPRWIALELYRRGLVEFKEKPVDLEDLAKIAYSEESSRKGIEFTKIKQYFYHIVCREIDELYERVERERDTGLLLDLRKYEDYLMRIGKSRVKKLIQLLFLKLPSEVSSKLSEEEKILYLLLKDILDHWLKRLRIEKGG